MIRQQHLIFLLFALLAFVPMAQAQSIDTSAKQAIVVDYETGTVLFAKNANQKMPTSSMSKVMTMYAVFEALKAGQISLNDSLPVSEKAWRKGGSKMFVEVDKNVRVEDLIRGVIVQSGNDATIVLAEGISGSEEAFSRKLNTIAGSLGMNNSKFMNASGWPDPEHYSTARDLALLSQRLIQDFPDYYPYYSETEFTFNNITQQNRNPLLYRNIGADGIKTGHTEAGGYGLMGSGVHEGRRVILVVNGLEDETARARESAKLLSWGLKSFTNKTFYKAGEIVGQAGVILGKKPAVNLVPAKDIRFTMPTNSSASIQAQIRTNQPLRAPLRKNQQVASLEIQIPGMESLVYPLYPQNDVEELGFFSKSLAKARMLILGQH